MASNQSHRFARSEADLTLRPPRINVRFFYVSPLAIDDPLSPVPPPSGTTAAATRHAPRPFSSSDHAALERAWSDLSEKLRKHKDKLVNDEQQSLSLPVNDSRSGHYRDRSQSGSRPASRASQVRNVNPSLCVSGRRSSDPRASSSSTRSSFNAADRRKFEHQPSALSRSSDTTTLEDTDFDAETSVDASSNRLQEENGSLEDTDIDKAPSGTTGTPFIRAPSRSKMSPVAFNEPTAPEDLHLASEIEQPTPDSKSSPLSSQTPVGVARLHQVSMPDLQMVPIYWSPVNDISSVIRGTWFYKDSMLPVECDVANMLEAGYIGLQPWTETWKDELSSAIEVGAAGEMKVLHQLWPSTEKRRGESRPGSARGSISGVPEEVTEEMKLDELLKDSAKLIEASTYITGADHKAVGDSLFGRDGQKRLYRNCGVIYANATTAYLLRPNLQPSAYYGRRPIANYIRKGHKIGISVVRGFDQRLWDHLHPSKRGPKAVRAHAGANLAQQSESQDVGPKPLLNAWGEAIAPVTDLVLVIHGIGQKLSERMESFHFTHAMNAFRREFNVELGSNSVKPNLREGMGRIMVLPVNWRSTLSFEDGGYKDDNEDASLNHFTLKDITPDSLPSVRNIVSDVMLDIPYYLSHHQPKMIAAVVKEANRIYNLWCKHNQGFEITGRVHLIAHSLGSVMAVDILSKQPTFLDPDRPRQVDTQDFKHFAFDTRNLFLCGSPAGFFLLLKKATLLPRRARGKPGTQGDDEIQDVVGEEGTYGCLAVDNIYNIVNPYDPVAYRMNAAVDSSYASSLKTAYIPHASVSWFPFGFSFGSSTATDPNQKRRELARLPSSVELETHNFTREEIAEQRAYLLNDNGQIDFFLRYGGGPLEIQYLTMLGAHSSYWISQDFTRFVVLEVGRKFGREGTLQSFRAVKKKAFTTR